MTSNFTGASKAALSPNKASENTVRGAIQRAQQGGYLSIPVSLIEALGDTR